MDAHSPASAAIDFSITDTHSLSLSHSRPTLPLSSQIPHTPSQPTKPQRPVTEPNRNWSERIDRPARRPGALPRSKAQVQPSPESRVPRASGPRNEQTHFRRPADPTHLASLPFPWLTTTVVHPVAPSLLPARAHTINNTCSTRQAVLLVSINQSLTINL